MESKAKTSLPRLSNANYNQRRQVIRIRQFRATHTRNQNHLFRNKTSMKKEIKWIIVTIIIFVVIGIVGTDEYEFEKRQESVITKTK